MSIILLNDKCSTFDADKWESKYGNALALLTSIVLMSMLLLKNLEGKWGWWMTVAAKTLTLLAMGELTWGEWHFLVMMGQFPKAPMERMTMSF
jgi:hypothetical protein